MEKFHTFNLGDFKITVLNDFGGTWSIYEMMPKVPQAALKSAFAANGYDETVARDGNNLLIDTGSEKILIDAGLPSPGDGIPRSGNLAAALQASGVDPNDIDLLIITHGDFDHIGGLGNYSRAKIILPDHAWKLWIDNTEKMVEEQTNLFKDNLTDAELEQRKAGRRRYASVLKQLENRIKRIDVDTEIVPGIQLLSA
ncbi:MAG: MBL fold metallo-hydrolase, partial [Chloroflexota bacterium]